MRLTPSGELFSGKGLKIMNLGDVQATTGVTAVLQNADDDAVDPHLERIKNEAGGEESDEEVYPGLTIEFSFLYLELDSSLFGLEPESFPVRDIFFKYKIC